MRTTTIDLEVLARIGRALADDTRRRILVRLLQGPAVPSELAAELSTSRANISNHLACLRGCDLVTAHERGRNVHYELAHPAFAELLEQLAALPLRPSDLR